MDDLYDTIKPGTMALIGGRRAVFLYEASYGGGGGPLWAIEGLSCQFTTRDFSAYRTGTCRRATPEEVEMELEDGTLITLPVTEICRFDQHHLDAGERYVFDDEDIVLT